MCCRDFEGSLKRREGVDGREVNEGRFCVAFEVPIVEESLLFVHK